MTNKEVVEAFAVGQTKGKGLHLFIEGNTIYSYGIHFPIATRIGTTTALFTTKGYSMTTSKHKNMVKRALKEQGVNLIETDKECLNRLVHPENTTVKPS